MDKQGLLDALAAKFTYVGTPQEVGEAEGIKRYIVGCWDVVGDVAVRTNVGFYVEDEGQPTEAAYWQNREPKPTPTLTWAQEVLNYIQSKIEDDTIEAAFIDSIDVQNETAEGRAYLIQATDIVERHILVDKDPSDVIRHRVIT